MPADKGPASHEVGEVAFRLMRRYGTWPDETSLPLLEQLLWFLISTRTTVENCETAFQALKARSGGWEGVAEASEESLYAPLRPSGLFRSRARNIKAVLAAVTARFGSLSMEAMRSWSDGECELFLSSLPGVGQKVARCVMSFGMGRRVFAVDAHIWRITRRLGWHSFASASPSGPGSDAIQGFALLADDPLSLHVNLIRLGREFCQAGTADCAPCPLSPGALCAAALRAGPGEAIVV